MLQESRELSAESLAGWRASWYGQAFDDAVRALVYIVPPEQPFSNQDFANWLYEAGIVSNHDKIHPARVNDVLLPMYMAGQIDRVKQRNHEGRRVYYYWTPNDRR